MGRRGRAGAAARYAPPPYRWMAGLLLGGAFLLCAGHTAPARAQAFEVYQYDSLGRLIIGWDSAGRQEGFTFDPAENRVQAAVTAGNPPAPPVPPVPPTPPSFQLLPNPQAAVIVPWKN